MDMRLKADFMDRWKEYFGGAELPIACWYAGDEVSVARAEPARGHKCFIADLSRIRAGESGRFDADAIGCSGGRRYLGFTREVMPDFEHFLSCGIPGVLEGARYKKTPDLVKESERRAPPFTAPAPFIVFKRWDGLEEEDVPEVVVFFATPDVLSGLFTLAGYDEAVLDAVHCPFCAGCGSIVKYPFLEKEAPRPRAVLGMFDVSARPFVPGSTLTFAVPMRKLASMVADMDESFLGTASWSALRRRIGQGLRKS